MEWIETTAKSVPEAKEMALDKLGVDDSEAEFEILEEPKAGLFGRVRGHARVRARVVPKSPRAKAERGDRRKSRGRKGSDSSGDEITESSPAEAAPVEATAPGSDSVRRVQSDATTRAKRVPKAIMEEVPVEDVQTSVEHFLVGLTTAFGLESDVRVELTDDEAIEANIDGKHGLLLGPKGRTLDAIQELTRVAAQRNAPSSARIRVDVGGYREARRLALVSFAQTAAERALAGQVEVVLEPMNAADRKVIHDSLGEVDGISTRSAGNDPRRRVIVVPEDTEDTATGHADEDDAVD